VREPTKEYRAYAALASSVRGDQTRAFNEAWQLRWARAAVTAAEKSQNVKAWENYRADRKY
jgi:hypothetical protein